MEQKAAYIARYRRLEVLDREWRKAQEAFDKEANELAQSIADSLYREGLDEPWAPGDPFDDIPQTMYVRGAAIARKASAAGDHWTEALVLWLLQQIGKFSEHEYNHVAKLLDAALQKVGAEEV